MGVRTSGVYRTGGGLVAWVADLGYNAQAVLDEIRAGSGCRCGAGHNRRNWRTAESIARETGIPRREVRRSAARLAAAGILEETAEAWRLSDAADAALTGVGG